MGGVAHAILATANLDGPTRRALEEAGVDINAIEATAETTVPQVGYGNPLDLHSGISSGIYGTIIFVLMLTIILTILTIKVNQMYKRTISPFSALIPVSFSITIIKGVQLTSALAKYCDTYTGNIGKPLGGLIAASIIMLIEIMIILIKNLYQSIKTLNKTYELDDMENANMIRPARLGFKYTLTACILAMLTNIILMPVWILFLVIGHTFTKQARNMIDASVSGSYEMHDEISVLDRPVNSNIHNQTDALEKLRMRQGQG